MDLGKLASLVNTSQTAFESEEKRSIDLNHGNGLKSMMKRAINLKIIEGLRANDAAKLEKEKEEEAKRLKLLM